MVLKAFFALVFLLVGGVVYALIRAPGTVIVRRSRSLSATAAEVFPWLVQAKRVCAWSPFLVGDPKLRLDFEGPAEGLHAAWRWKGDTPPAEGRAEIVAVEAGKRVRIRLDMVRPFRGGNEGEFIVEPGPGGSVVTWIVFEKAWIPRVLSVFIDLDGQIGAQFEAGLDLLEQKLGQSINLRRAGDEKNN